MHTHNETYNGHEFEISTIPGGWKPFRVVFLSPGLSTEKPAHAWNEHEAREYAHWLIDKFENDRAHFQADAEEAERYEGYEPQEEEI